MAENKRLLSQRGATARLNINQRTFHKYREQGLIVPLGVTETGGFIYEAEYIDELKRQLKPAAAFQPRLVISEAAVINNGTAGQCQ